MRIDAMSSALLGMQSAAQRLDSAGSRIASGNLDTLAADVVDLVTSNVQMKASVAVGRTADQTLGTLLDMVG
jgi:hypothetical protein